MEFANCIERVSSLCILFVNYLLFNGKIVILRLLQRLSGFLDLKFTQNTRLINCFIKSILCRQLQKVAKLRQFFSRS
jgi:hypothetical protein